MDAGTGSLALQAERRPFARCGRCVLCQWGKDVRKAMIHQRDQQRIGTQQWNWNSLFVSFHFGDWFAPGGEGVSISTLLFVEFGGRVMEIRT